MRSWLLDDLDNPAAARFDQNRAAVHDRVAIVSDAIFRRHVVIGDAFFRQNRADPDILAVLIGRVTPFDDIIAKAGTLVDAKDTVDAADHAANDPTDDRSDRTAGSLAFS